MARADDELSFQLAAPSRAVVPPLAVQGTTRCSSRRPLPKGQVTNAQVFLKPLHPAGLLQEEEQMKKRVGAKLEMARFLQDTVAEMAKDMKGSKSGATQASAEQLYQFLKKVSCRPRMLHSLGPGIIS